MNRTMNRATIDVCSSSKRLGLNPFEEAAFTAATNKLSETIKHEPYTGPGDYETTSIVGNLKISLSKIKSGPSYSFGKESKEITERHSNSQSEFERQHNRKF
jgi:hypothetical protein